MGRMKDIYIAREEWANALRMELDEDTTIVETDYPEWWTVQLHDGIKVSKVADSWYVEADGVDPVEYDPARPHQRDALIAGLRDTKLGNDGCCDECGLPHDEPENTHNTIKENN